MIIKYGWSPDGVRTSTGLDIGRYNLPHQTVFSATHHGLIVTHSFGVYKNPGLRCGRLFIFICCLGGCRCGDMHCVRLFMYKRKENKSRWVGLSLTGKKPANVTLISGTSE